MKKYLLIYHKEDNDGVFSGAIFYNYLVNKLNTSKENIELFGADYNLLSSYAASHKVEELKCTYDSIIMTDISFNDPKYMKKLYKEFGTDFIWCDHHKPIIDASYKYKFAECPGIRNTTKSAILCVYEYLYDQFNEIYSTINKQANPEFPELFRILSGWDSWSYEREGYEFDYVRNINKGITTVLKLDFEKVLQKVSEIINDYTNNPGYNNLTVEIDFIQHVYNIGKSLNEYEDNVMADIIKNSGDCSWKVIVNDENGKPLARTACALFHQGASNSTMFKSLIGKGIEQGLVFKHQSNGNWVLSMYNINDNAEFHCGEFLKEKYNGGGHKGAAGCTLTQKQFIDILTHKIL